MQDQSTQETGAHTASQKIEIIPAIMPRNFRDLSEHAVRVKGLAKVAQIDVVDGVFAAKRTWPYVPEDGLSEFARIAREEDTFPFAESLEYEIDLMVENPEHVVDSWVMAGAKRIIVHVESGRFESVLDALKGRYIKGGEQQNSFGVELGIALSADTDVSAIEPYLEEVSFVQCMGIARIGFQGEPLDERVFEKLSRLRAEHHALILSVDGGVRQENARALVEAGANRLVSGSALFESDDVGKALAQLRRAAEHLRT